MPTPFRRSPRGFTLIELLVVIAIIAILAAILFPVFAQARATARKAACLSNMKQIGLAITQYNQDYDESYPLGQAGTGAVIISWPTMIYPYVKNGGVFVCPDGERDLTTKQLSPTISRQYCGITDTNYVPNMFNQAGDGSQPPASALVHRLSYGRNLITPSSWTTAGWNNAGKQGFVGIGTATQPITEAQIEDISGTIHIVDSWTTQCYQGNSIRGIQFEDRTDHFPTATTSKVANRHGEGFVAVYGDGHAKWQKWGSTKPGNWSIQAND